MTSNFPSSVELTSSMLRILKLHPQGLSTKEIDQAVVAELGISGEVASIIRSGNRTEIQYRLAWSRTKAKKAGLIERIGTSKWCLK